MFPILDIRLSWIIYSHRNVECDELGMEKCETDNYSCTLPIASNPLS